MAADEEIAVHYENFVVGRIKIHGPQGIAFAYDPRWLATKGNFPLSATLPLEHGEFGNDVIAPWLANLLPEDQLLAAVSRVLGVSASDTVAILRIIGGDTAGAISIGEAGNRGAWTCTYLTEQYDADTDASALGSHFDDLGRRPFLAGEDGIRLSLAGGQKKTALTVFDPAGHPKLGLPDSGDRLAIPKNGAPSTIIIKPDNPMLPGIVENEAYCLALAGMIGIPAVESTIVQADGQTALAVARYDRTIRRDGSIQRLHQEDFAQANGIHPGRKYERGIAQGLTLNELISTGEFLPPEEALKLHDQVIFNILAANTDAHAKNYSMMLAGERTLAPLYDVSTVLHWGHVNQYHAQNIAGKKRKPGDTARRHWDRISEEAGLNARGTRLRVQELVDRMVAKRVEATETVAAQPGASREMVEHVAEIVESNALRIAGRLDESQ